MNLDLFDNKLDNLRNNKLSQKFINELETFWNKSNNKQNEISLDNTMYKGNKIITEYRDKMFIERNNILNNYAKKTKDKGLMYYVYSKNSESNNKYNLCICSEEMSHRIIEENESILPRSIDVGCVLRKYENKYVVDLKSTKEVANEIDRMRDSILKEQNKFLQSKRIEEHIYEISEISEDSIWLFDISDNTNRAIEEIKIDKEILKTSKIGDLLVYRNGKYQKY